MFARDSRVFSRSECCCRSAPPPLWAAGSGLGLHPQYRLSIHRFKMNQRHEYPTPKFRNTKGFSRYSLRRSERTSSKSFWACSMLPNRPATGSSSVCVFSSAFLSESQRWSCCSFRLMSLCSSISFCRYLWTELLLYKSPASQCERRFGTALVPRSCTSVKFAYLSLLWPVGVPHGSPRRGTTRLQRPHSPNQRGENISAHF